MKRKETVTGAAFDGRKLVGHCNIERRMRKDVAHAGRWEQSYSTDTGASDWERD